MNDELTASTGMNPAPVTLRKSLWQQILTRIAALREDISRTFESPNGVIDLVRNAGSQSAKGTHLF